MKRAALMIALIGCASAQTYMPPETPFGQIHVLVVDGSNKPLPGVTVMIGRNPGPAAAKQVQITPPNGHLIFKDEGQGEYYVHCQLSGYVSELLGPIRVSYKNPSLHELRVTMTTANAQY